MKSQKAPPVRPLGARSFGRRLRDALLLPLALALMLVEWGMREGSRVLRRWGPLRWLETRLAGLPAWAILPLFLIPEVMSHVAGFYAAYLLARGKVLAATTVAVFVKGIALLIALWIYQACRPALMTIPWFARVHGKVEAARRWALEKIGPAFDRARRLVRRLIVRRVAVDGEPGAAHAGRRLAAIRIWLRRRLSRTR